MLHCFIIFLSFHDMSICLCVCSAYGACMPMHWACLVRGGVPDHYPPGHRMPSVWIMHARERVCKTCAHQIHFF